MSGSNGDHRFQFDELPSGLGESMIGYVTRGVPPGEGSFMHALLCNDLKETFGRADEGNLARLHSIVSWCYRRLPCDAWGSAERVDAWCAHGGTSGRTT